MNWQHFRAFVWLRWRVRVNQVRRAGTVNAVILAILAAGAAVLSVLLFVVLFLVGLFGLTDASPLVLLYVWDGLVVAFLFFWMIGLLTDLQRSEALSLDKFLYLPVSVWGAFVVNYLSSLFSLVLIVFGPAMLGLILGLVFSKGPAMLLLLPLLAAFLLMVTALTYQFQGWLAALMVNPRRRRTVIVVVTMSLVLLFQLPNLINILRPWKNTNPIEQIARLTEGETELRRALEAKEITFAEFQRRREQLEREQEESNRQMGQTVERTVGLLNLVLPPGWLPLGVEALAEGTPLPALLGTLGLTLIGAGSLWRAYTTTLRLYRGQFTSGKRRRPTVAAPPAAAPPAFLLEKEIPGVSDQAAAVALSSFRSLMRAPEAKMMLLSPLIMLVIFGGMFLSQPNLAVSEDFRPLMAFGAMAMILLTLVQFVGNQFAFDRNGFRVYVLCGASRADILLGKNLAAAPLALGMGALAAGLLQVVAPMRLDHFLAFFPQAVSMYLLFCLLANGMSILAPQPIAAGSFRPSSIKGITILLNFAFLFVFLPVLSPTLLPLAFEIALQRLGWGEGVPICLLLSLAECVAVVGLYRLILGGEGRWLQAREQKILEIVATRAE